MVVERLKGLRERRAWSVPVRRPERTFCIPANHGVKKGGARLGARRTGSPKSDRPGPGSGEESTATVCRGGDVEGSAGCRRFHDAKRLVCQNSLGTCRGKDCGAATLGGFSETDKIKILSCASL